MNVVFQLSNSQEWGDKILITGSPEELKLMQENMAYWEERRRKELDEIVFSVLTPYTPVYIPDKSS